MHQERVGKILTLVYELPGDCTLYFPTNVGDSQAFGEMEVTLVSEEQVMDYIMRRDFKVNVRGETDSRSLTHYHF